MENLTLKSKPGSAGDARMTANHRYLPEADTLQHLFDTSPVEGPPGATICIATNVTEKAQEWLAAWQREKAGGDNKRAATKRGNHVQRLEWGKQVHKNIAQKDPIEFAVSEHRRGQVINRGVATSDG